MYPYDVCAVRQINKRRTRHGDTMERYQRLEHTADVMVKCTGKDLCECFANAAYAMFDQMIDITAVENTTERSFETEEKDDCDRLYAFLSELLFISDCESLVFSEFDVISDGNKIKCTAHGESLDVKKHHARAEIKAVTYHMLEVDRDTPSVTVIFDV